MGVCAQCGQENPEGFRFCGSCGAELAAVPPAVREVRKTVTVLFCDLAGYTSTGERLDPEALRRVQSGYFEEARTALERHGGTVEKFIGDAVMAVFGIPQVHEDDALRALRAAAELRQAVDRLGLQARIGVNTGEVVAGSGDALVTGDAVNTAARLEQGAQPGEILLGEQTLRLARDAVEVERVEPLELKGKAHPLPAFRLLNLLEGAPAFERRLDSPMVGRERELALLRQAFDRAVSERGCHLFTVLGPAGVGKSRLVAEFVADVRQEAAVLSGRCLAYGEGITYWPLVEVFREAGAEEDLSEALSRLTPEETSWAVRTALERRARERPLLLLLDDLHWAQPTFLDLVEHVADWSRDAPMLLLCVARPELLDARPAWGGGKLNATAVLLEPLSADESERLISNLAIRLVLDAGVRARIVEAADGNPLFVEEMLAMVAEENGGAEIEVPPTIQALLAARLDRLQPREREVAERASVEGKVFHRGAVAELTADELRPEVMSHLMSLVRKELIRPDESALPGEDAFRFRHLLIRDAAYQSLPKEMRAELHERFASWLERVAVGRLEEYEEIVGYHLEQAYRYRQELGPLDESAGELGRDAARRLAAAGRRALGRGDIPAAVSLLDRSVALRPQDDLERGELLLPLGEALRLAGDFGRAEAVLEDAAAEARERGNRRLELRVGLAQQDLWVQSQPGLTGMLEASRICEEAVAELAELDDDQGVAIGSHILGKLFIWSGDSTRAAEAYSRALEHARRVGDVGLAVDCLDWLALSAWWGTTPVAEGITRCDELEEQSKAEFDREAPSANVARGVLLAMAGRIDEGREAIERARGVFAERGSRLEWAGTALAAGDAEMIAGEAEAAERLLREGYEALVAMNEHGYLSSTAAHLAWVLAFGFQGRDDEAFELTAVAERIAATDDIEPQAIWRGARALVLARRGDAQRAEALAREAIALVDETDWLYVRAELHSGLAEVLEAAGRREDGLAALQRAIAVWEQKGNVVSAERLRQRLAALSRSAQPPATA